MFTLRAVTSHTLKDRITNQEIIKQENTQGNKKFIKEKKK